MHPLIKVQVPAAFCLCLVLNSPRGHIRRREACIPLSDSIPLTEAWAATCTMDWRLELTEEDETCSVPRQDNLQFFIA